jgi:DNA (cytosine-5)-methyltransferase 1
MGTHGNTRSRRESPDTSASLFSHLESEPRSRDIFDHLGIDCHTPGWPDAAGARLRQLTGERLRPIRTLSLFSGAGGLDIGFHDAGFRIAEAVEIDPRCVGALAHNAGNRKALGGTCVVGCDIREYQPHPNEGYEFVIGGPPCQSFSAAGRRAAGVPGINDARGTLFEEFVRILKLVKPRGFLFENVYGITGANGGEAWQAIRKGFANAGFQISFRILDAADYGVPQHRERAIIVGLRNGAFCFPRPTHGPDSLTGRPHFAAGVAVAGAPNEPAAPTVVNGRYGHLLSEVPPGLNYSFFTEKMGHPRPVFAWRSKFSDFLYKADPQQPIRTLKAQGGQYTGPFHWDNRPFSIAEFKRLQTFPDQYELLVGRQAAVKMIGNSVPPQFARMLALAVRVQVFGDSLPWTLDFLREGEQLRFRQRKRSRTTDYQTKAREAIARVPRQRRRATTSRTYCANLTDEFNLIPDADGVLAVEFHATRSAWSFGVQVGQEPAVNGIKLTPIQGQRWSLPVPCVNLFFGNDWRTYTSAWKAFESELVRNGHKADLVQLSGYYQYEPSMRVEAEFGGTGDTNWLVLSRVVTGVGVAATLTTKRLAALWEVTQAEADSAMRWLRGVGYEVRNSNTNSEIPSRHYLIPYAFPTLNSQSVQLRKCLD